MTREAYKHDLLIKYYESLLKVSSKKKSVGPPVVGKQSLVPWFKKRLL